MNELDIVTLEEDESETRESRTERELRKRKIGRIIKIRMLVIIFGLGILAGIVKSGIGQGFWPLWLVQYQNAIFGALLFMLVFVILFSPIVVEFFKDPRPFSGSKPPPYGGGGGVF
jgi:hypothetical protein